MCPLRKRHQREAAIGRAMGRALYSMPGRDGDVGYLFALGSGGGGRADGLLINMVVSGIFADKAHVELAVEEMKRDGFRNADISVLFAYNDDTKAYVLARTTEQSDAAMDQGICRAAIGGALGWLAGIDILDIPGLGPFMAAGRHCHLGLDGVV